MQSTDPDVSLKYRAILAYVSQTGGTGGWLTSFARKDEFFWSTNVGANRALTAAVTTSGQVAGGEATRAVDGLADAAHSWTASSGAGAWIQLTWPSQVVLSEMDLQDLIETWNNVLSGTLSFSDGSTVPVGALPVGGQVLPVTFSPRSVTWVRFTIHSVAGTAGLSELAALGPAATGNTPPTIVSGPLTDLDPIYAWETALFTVDGWDLDGDPLTASWSADGGAMQGAGATAVFQPPAVSQATTFTVSAQLSDGRGGVAGNVGFVTVLPSYDAVGLHPVQLVGGASAQGIVTLASAAPAGGLTVSLASSDNALVTVPAAVSIAAGALSGTFTVTTAPVGATFQATISAQIPDRPLQTATLLVFPPLTGTNLARAATVSVSSQAGGQPGTAAIDGVVSGFPLDGSREWAANGTDGQWIRLTWPAPVYLGGVTLHDRINLTDRILAGRLVFSDGSSVPVGALPDDGTGLVVRFPERSVTSVRLFIDRVNGWNTGLAEIEAYAPLADALALSPTGVGGGGSVQGTVVLALPASSGGEVVPLSSSDPAASVPATVTVPAGSTTATFTVTTQVVSEGHTAVITASFARGARSASLTIAPVTLAGLTFSPATFLGGGGTLGTVQLSVAAPADLGVSLASSDPTVVVPATVTVAAGASSATFPAFSSAVSTLTPATVTATLGTSQAAADLLLLPVLGDVNLARSAQATASSPAPGAMQDATKAIDGWIDGYPNDATREWATTGERSGAWIRLAWTTPVTLEEARLYDRPNLDDHVLAGRLVFSDGSTVAVGALPNDASSPFLVDFEPRTVSWVQLVVDSAGGYNVGLAELEVYGPAAATSSFTASPSSVRAGGLVTGTVNLGLVAPAGGTVVPLSSSDAALPVPASVTVAQGAHSATFTALAGSVSTATAVTLTASLPGAARTVTVTVLPPAVSNLTLTPSSVTEGAPAEGTVILDQAAGSGGMLVQLASDSAAALVPASVPIPAGQSSATFAVSTAPVSTATTAVITATAGGVSATASLTVNPVPLASVGVSPASLAGGSSALGTVTLAVPAVGGGALVSLSSSDAALVVPASVTVLAGSTTATFPVTTFAVSTSTPVTVTAARGSVARTATVTVRPPALAQLILSPSSLTEGASASGSVTLEQPAGASGVIVQLTAGNPSALAVPASVTVAAGQSSAAFDAVAGAVGATTVVEVTAASGGATRTATVTVNPIAVTGLAVSPGSVTGGTSATGTVTLAVPAVQPIVVALSDDSAAATVPATVTVPAGASTATFTVTTVVVATTTTVTLTASRAGTSATAGLTVSPPPLSALRLAATTLVGGSSTTGTITLASAAPSGGLAVSLSSGNAAASVPATVTVAAGATSATFRVTTTPVSADTPVTLTAMLGGASLDTALTVQAPRPRSLALSPSTVTGSQTSTGTVRLTGAAPAGGTVVMLSSSNQAAATVPTSVTVAAGATTATFTVQTTAVTANTVVAIAATAAGTTVQTNLSVRLLAVSSMNLSPNSIMGGYGSTGTVMLTRAALAGGFTVTLSSSNPAATVPATVTVAAGATTATFPVTTTAVGARTTSSISSSGGGVTRSATLTITP